jgi:hypothetical protein
MNDLENDIAEAIGDREFLETALENVRPLLNDSGMEAYLRLIKMVLPYDEDFSIWMLNAGKKVLSVLDSESARTEALETVASMGKARWSVAAAIFRELPSFIDIEQELPIEWFNYCSSISEVDQDVAVEFIEASPEMLEILDTDGFDSWASLGTEIARKSWKSAKEYFKASPEVIKRIDHDDMREWARIGLHLIDNAPELKAKHKASSMLAQGADAGTTRKLDLAIQYFKSAPQVLGRLSIKDLKQWVEAGMREEHGESGKSQAFFSLDSGKSRIAVDTLVKGLELKDTHVVLSSYAEALAGKKVLLRSSSLFYKDLPGLSRYISITDGERVFLPSKITIFEDNELNFKVFKLMLTHELAHIEHGTFDLDADDLSRLNSFGDPGLAYTVLEFLEDERIDYLLGIQYPGLSRDKQHVLKSYIEAKPEEVKVMSVFESLSFGDLRSDIPNDGCNALLVKVLQDAAWKVRDESLNVHDVLTITLRICTLLEDSPVMKLGWGRRMQDRIFYRGVLDFALIEKTREGMKILTDDMFSRFHSRNNEVKVEDVNEALTRIEHSEGIEPECLLWQTCDLEKLDMLYEDAQKIMEDMEAERHIRRTVYYDEWDAEMDDYKKEWCKVREMDMPGGSLSFYEDTIKENYGVVSLLRRHFGLLRPDRIQRFFREERGDDIDYDALVESMVELQAGRTPSDKVYIRREKNLRDVSVAFLVDMSYSTGDELASGKRIIDVEREGLVLMAEALESIGDQWAVYGFSTNNRDKVDFHIVRDFNMPFNSDVKKRFENIQPMAQTRLGAAIRHASAMLQRQSSRIRLLILLSDGRPYDVDYGDASYAVEDTKRALWEARRKGVNSFCITVDKKSSNYLTYMYGESNFTIIDNVDALPAMLPLIYKRLTT